MLLPFSLLTPLRRVNPQTTRVSTECKTPLESGVGGHAALQAMIANEREANVERCPLRLHLKLLAGSRPGLGCHFPGVYSRER